MSEDNRLTKQELSWLLTQEARAAARTLRKGVATLSQHPPAVDPQEPLGVTADVASSIEAIDHAMKMLASLNAGSETPRGGRGRLDLAAILYEIAPNARVHMELGAGTEVYADEVELRRMCQVLVSQVGGIAAGGANAPDITVARADDFVRVSVALGPEAGATSSTERAWLSRMAVRYGGRLELGGTEQVLVLPAADVEERREVEELRQELAAAQEQGEAYARELAAVFSSTDFEEEKSAGPSTIPPPTGMLPAIISLASAVVSQLREPTTALKKLLDQEGTALQKDVSSALHSCREQSRNLIGALNKLADLDESELPSVVQVKKLVNHSVDDLALLLDKRDITLEIDIANDLQVIAPEHYLGVLLALMLEHAVAATPEGQRIRLSARKEGLYCIIIVDDSGASIPSNMRNAVVWHHVEPSTLGRPKGVQLLGAASLVAYLNGSFKLEDVPSGGVRAVASIPVS